MILPVLKRLRPTIVTGLCTGARIRYVGGRIDRLEALLVQMEISLDEMKGPMAASLAAVKIDLGKAMARQDSLETRIMAQAMHHRTDCGGLVTK